MENKNELTNCPQCDNACPRDQLKCGRGRAFFGVGSPETGKDERAHHHRDHGNHRHGDHDHGEHGHHRHKTQEN